MAAAGQMAEFFATLGIKIQKGDLQKVDKQLDALEARAKRFTEGGLSDIRVNISRFSFSDNFNSRLHTALKRRLQVVSNKGVAPEITFSKFNVDINAIRRQMRVAFTQDLSPEITFRNFDVDRSALLREMRAAVNYVEGNLRVRIRPDVQRPTGDYSRPPRSDFNRTAGSFGAGLGFGSATAGLGRGFLPGLGVAFGVSQLNKINQELMGQQYAAQAIFGDTESATTNMDWLRTFSDEVGIHYRNQAQPYLRMMASATNAGMGVGETQALFAGVARYGRTMGLGSEDMKGSLRAIEQMLNKQQVYAEELKTQLAERMPGVISAMAEAVTGDANNTQELFKLMEDGQVSATKVLPMFAQILEERALKGGAYLEAIRASSAEQQRFNSAFDDLVRVFGESGFEEGQASLFRMMASYLKELTPLIEAFGGAWKYIESVVRVPFGLIEDGQFGLEKFSEYTGIAKSELVALGTALSLLAFPLTRTVTLIFGALTLLEDFTGFLTGQRTSLIEQLLGDNAEVTRNNFIELFTTLGQLVETLWERLTDVFNLLTKNMEGGWVQYLNKTLTGLEELLYRINLLLGGPTKAQIQAESFKSSNPYIANSAALDQQIKAEENKGYFDKLFGGEGGVKAARFLYDRTIFGFLDNMFTGGKGALPFFSKLESAVDPEVIARAPLLPFLMSDEQVKNSYFSGNQISQYNPNTPTTSAGDTYDIKVEISGDNKKAEEIADEVINRVKSDMLKPVADKARRASK